MISRAARAHRVVVAVLVFAAVFEMALYITKETPAIYDHVPWLNDPYDTALSFALFCVPLICVPSGLRLLAGRREPQSRRRLADLVRACGVALAVIAATLAACWAAVAQGANRPAWTSVTAIQIIGLVLLSAGSVAGVAGLRVAAAALRPRGEVTASPSADSGPQPPDALPGCRIHPVAVPDLHKTRSCHWPMTIPEWLPPRQARCLRASPPPGLHN